VNFLHSATFSPERAPETCSAQSACARALLDEVIQIFEVKENKVINGF